MVFGNTLKEDATMRILDDIEKMFTTIFEVLFKDQM
jgi:hypothetical protein